VTLAPGSTTRLELPDPAYGTVETDAVPRSWSGIVLDPQVGGGARDLEVGPPARVPAGRYDVSLRYGSLRVRLPNVEVPPGGRVRLPAGPELHPVEVVLRSEPPFATSLVVVLQLDADDPRRGHGGFFEAHDAGRFRGELPRGRYAVLTRASLVGELTIPASGPLVVDAAPFTATLRFQGPPSLRPGEALRGRANVAARALTAQVPYENSPGNFQVVAGPEPGEPVTFELALPGAYVVRGVTDLGPFAVPVELAPGREVIVTIPE
jgi:hypothetical protein